MSLVTSLVTKKIFWILFPKITVGDIPEMLSIKVNGREPPLGVQKSLKLWKSDSDDSEIEYEHRIESGQDIEFLGAQVNH